MCYSESCTLLTIISWCIAIGKKGEGEGGQGEAASQDQRARAIAWGQDHGLVVECRRLDRLRSEDATAEVRVLCSGSRVPVTRLYFHFLLPIPCVDGISCIRIDADIPALPNRTSIRAAIENVTSSV